MLGAVAVVVAIAVCEISKWRVSGGEDDSRFLSIGLRSGVTIGYMFSTGRYIEVRHLRGSLVPVPALRLCTSSVLGGCGCCYQSQFVRHSGFERCLLIGWWG